MDNLKKSVFTTDLFKQYKKHLGAVRYRVLLEGQKLVVPKRVKQLLHFNDFSLLTPTVPVYKMSRRIKADVFLKSILLPSAYKKQKLPWMLFCESVVQSLKQTSYQLINLSLYLYL